MSEPRPGLTDTHCHLTLPQFNSEVDQLLERALAAGVERVVVPGIDLDTSRAAVQLAERLPSVYAAVGLHPHSASDWSAELGSELEQLSRSPKVVAIGEIGLDFYRELAPRSLQRQALGGQLELAKQLGKPVIVHNREATQELLEVLIEWAGGLDTDRKRRAGVLHAFSGDQQEAELAIESGFYLGVAGPVTYPNADDLRDTLRLLPLARLLIETDSPYLAPQPRRGKRNEPAYLPFIAEGLATLQGAELAATADATSENAAELFDLKHGNQDPQLH